MTDQMPILSVKHLQVMFKTPRGNLQAVCDVSFDVQHGEIFGIVGESGCGKSVTSLAVMRLITKPGKITKGQIRFEGEDLLQKSNKDMRAMRGNDMAMIFQDPLSSLNPVFSVGEQLTRVLRLHRPISKRDASQQIQEALASVELPDPRRIMRAYPHELSGGQQQRVMIAMALASKPKLLIADEPTTALDVTIQAQILRLLRQLRQDFGITIMLITHDMGVIAETCDHVAVFYAGRVVEIGQTRDLFDFPRHPYTQGLMAAIPQPEYKGSKLAAIPGTVPNNPGAVKGCAFADRCPHVFDRCRAEASRLFSVSGSQHFSACFLADEGDS
jgi:peptide/nickel transport system ATP-binding protein